MAEVVESNGATEDVPSSRAGDRGSPVGGGEVRPAALLRTDSGGGGGQKSILDFLGIFDTRRFFYIPTERQAETAAGEGEGILDSLASWLEVVQGGR